MYSRRGGQDFEFDDYMQYASLGLMECVDRYQPGLGASFKTYATTRMTGSILNGLRLTERQQQLSIQRRMTATGERVASLAEDDARMAPSRPRRCSEGWRPPAWAWRWACWKGPA